jgi:hypothetical protein
MSATTRTPAQRLSAPFKCVPLVLAMVWVAVQTLPAQAYQSDDAPRAGQRVAPARRPMTTTRPIA